jgi:tripartite-type tricarboxylate transporter receptor subunit TctC
MAGIVMVRITYKGTAPALAAVISGEVQLTFTSAASVAPHVKTGRLRVLGVTSLTPSTLAPGVPAIASSGLPGYESKSLYAMFAPAKTPPLIVNRLNQESARVLNSPEVKSKLLVTGIEVVASSPEQAAAAIKSEMSVMDKMMKDASLRTP